MTKTNKLSLLAIMIVALTSLTSCAISNENDNKIAALLKQAEPPTGIVFEVVSAFNDTLNHAIPKISRYSSKLKQRFPDLDIVVVTHGNEQFALTKKNKKKYLQLHNKVRTLVEQKDLTVHICATYAGIKAVSENAFPDYINVAASGPAQIKNYQELGYELIIINNL